jgi:hypothetical protein
MVRGYLYSQVADRKPVSLLSDYKANTSPVIKTSRLL